MAKKILRIGSFALGGIGGGLAVNALLGKKKNKDPRGYGEPLPVGTINPDGSPIPVDKKRRRLPTPTSAILDAAPGSSTLGG